MENREFLQLAKDYDNQYIGGWYLSEKLDGMRCYWDGGLTRGMPVELVPFANLEKSGYGSICTGLWSRYGNVIHAPDWWLNKLPSIPLDGELYCGRGKFQQVMSICRTGVENRVASEWESVGYKVFDCPPYNKVFSVGRINNTNYKKIYDGAMLAWIDHHLKQKGVSIYTGITLSFVDVLKLLKVRVVENDVVTIHQQTKLPMDQVAAKLSLVTSLESVLSLGGEGLIVRDCYGFWTPKRVAKVLKVKDLRDDEGIVVGWKAGEYGIEGKLHGKMGSLLVEWGGRQFGVSGFTDAERLLVGDAAVWALANPGREAPQLFECGFKRGTVVTFKYRELTEDGKPKEARYLRKKVSE